MDKKHNPYLTPVARELRRNMTPEERRLWYDFLRSYPVKFTKQKVMGRFVLDFYCAKAKLALEIDGIQHYDKAGAARDRERTAYLSQYGIEVLRLKNYEVAQGFQQVCNYD